MAGATFKAPQGIAWWHVDRDSGEEYVEFRDDVRKWCREHLKRVPRPFVIEGEDAEDIWVHILDDADLIAFKMMWGTA